MSPKTPARRIAIGYFFFWLIVLLAGANKPPPPGFNVFVIFDIGAAIAVNYRMPTYMVWHETRKKFRWLLCPAYGSAEISPRQATHKRYRRCRLKE